jgi:hypothetical protein
MAILTYRADKESSLTYDEMDNNFKYFKEDPEINSIKISVKDNLNNLSNLPVGSLTGLLDFDPNNDVAEPGTGFRLFVKINETLWDPIITETVDVEVNIASSTVTGIVKIGTGLDIQVDGLLSHQQEDGYYHVPANGTTNDGNFLKATGASGVYTWATVDALPNQAGKIDALLTTDGTDASWTWELTDSITGYTFPSTDNSTGIATTEFVQTAIENLINLAPGVLDTLGEIADALNNDPNVYTTLLNKIVPGVDQHYHNKMPHISNPLGIGTEGLLTFNYYDGTDYAVELWTTQTYTDDSDDNAATTAFVHSQFDHSIVVAGTIEANDFIIPSDRSLKTNIKPLEVDAINLLTTIDAVTFTNLSGEDDIGFIAQDFNKYMPVLTSVTEDELLSLKYSKITALLWKQNQELLKRIEILENES